MGSCNTAIHLSKNPRTTPRTHPPPAPRGRGVAYGAACAKWSLYIILNYRQDKIPRPAAPHGAADALRHDPPVQARAAFRGDARVGRVVRRRRLPLRLTSAVGFTRSRHSPLRDHATVKSVRLLWRARVRTPGSTMTRSRRRQGARRRLPTASVSSRRSSLGRRSAAVAARGARPPRLR
jgi:hypothetical protein